MTDYMIPRRTTGITHIDFNDSYVLLREDGSVEIRAGASSILMHPEGEIIIQGSRIKFLSDVIEVNDSEINMASSNPSQPALIRKKGMLPSDRSLKDY